MSNILIVLTSHDTLGDTGEKTGFWLEELAAPYYAFIDAGHSVTLASPKGGQPPLDPKSSADDMQTDDTRRFNQDTDALGALANTAVLSDINPDDFDAVFYPGGHGPLWDLVSDPDSIATIQAMWEADKPVAAVCHGPVVLANAVDAQGQPIVKGRTVTAFTNSEEAAVELTDVVPELLEDQLVAKGANFRAGDDWAPFAVVDGKLVTGQNPASSVLTAKHTMALL